jgi:hypothetical protein
MIAKRLTRGPSILPLIRRQRTSPCMRTDFSLFRERLAEACRARNLTKAKICQGIELGAKRAQNLSVTGPGAIDLYRVCQIADALRWHEPHVRPLDRFANRFRVSRIILLPFDIRLDVGGRHEFHGMTACLQLARPVMRCRTGFDANQARRELREVPQDMRPAKLPA